MELSDKINQLNHSKKAQAWIFMIINYVLSYLALTDNDMLWGESYKPIGSLFILTSIYLTYLHIKSWMTGKDVWEKVNFGLIGGEEELNESVMTKKAKKILLRVLAIGGILFIVAIVVVVIYAYIVS